MSSALLKPKPHAPRKAGAEALEPAVAPAGAARAAKAAKYLPWSEGSEKKVTSMLAEFMSVLDFTEAARCLEDASVDPKDRARVAALILEFAMELGFGEPASKKRAKLVDLLKSLHASSWLAGQDVLAGSRESVRKLQEVAVDLPVAPKILGELIGLLVCRGVLQLGQLLDGASLRSFFDNVPDDEDEDEARDRIAVAADLVVSTLGTVQKESGEKVLLDKVAESGFRVEASLGLPAEEARTLLEGKGVSGKVALV